jgi:SsrA-binding protein
MARRKKPKKGRTDPILERNRRAKFDYFIDDTLEAGIMLVGSETKAIRDGRASLAEAYCAFKGDELFLMGMHVGEYTHAHDRNHLPLRPRKLLLHRRELDRLRIAVQREGMTLVPLDLHVKNRRIKVSLGLARGKKLHDKRHSIRERDEKREMDRARRGRLD